MGAVLHAHADLVAESPFMPAGGSAALAAQGANGPVGPIELRGMMATADGDSYCIYDTAKKKDIWVGMNEAGHDFVVRSADAASDSVTVDYQGRSLKLTLKAAKVASAAVQGGPATAITSTVAVNPSPADEQRRLDAVSQEVRRRRMEREKSLQDPRAGPGAFSPPGVPQPGNMPPPGGR
jgi:hypothetical protein